MGLSDDDLETAMTMCNVTQSHSATKLSLFPAARRQGVLCKTAIAFTLGSLQAPLLRFINLNQLSD